jgi:hypothetical protein
LSNQKGIYSENNESKEEPDSDEKDSDRLQERNRKKPNYEPDFLTNLIVCCYSENNVSLYDSLGSIHIKNDGVDSIIYVTKFFR